MSAQPEVPSLPQNNSSGWLSQNFMMSASISRDSASRCGGGALGADGGATFGAGCAVVFGTNRNDGTSMHPSDRQIRNRVASPANAGVASRQAAMTIVIWRSTGQILRFGPLDYLTSIRALIKFGIASYLFLKTRTPRRACARLSGTCWPGSVAML